MDPRGHRRPVVRREAVRDVPEGRDRLRRADAPAIPRRGRLIALLGLALVAPAAGAHPQHTAVGDRYVKLVAEDGRLRVVYSLSYGPMGAAQERQRMDANHDGRLTAAETSAAARELGSRLSGSAELTVDGERVELRWGAPFVAPAAGRIDTSPLTIELSAVVDLPGGESHIRFADLPSLPNVERSDYAFEAREPAEILASGAGEAPAAQERLVSILDQRARGPRIVSLRVRLPGGGIPWYAWVAVGVASVVVVGGAVIWRRKVSGRRTGT